VQCTLADVAERNSGSEVVPTTRPDDVLELAEADYKFGSGRLTLRVSDLMHTQRFPDGLWLYVRGVQLDEAGRPGSQRQVLVRVAALPGCIRQPAAVATLQ
jgi:hypothetical protein